MNNNKQLKASRGSTLTILVIIAVIVTTLGAYVATKGFSDFGIFGIGASDGELKIVSMNPPDRVADGVVSLFEYQSNPLFDKYLGQSEVVKKTQDKGATYSGKINNIVLSDQTDSTDAKMLKALNISWQLMTDKKASFKASFNSAVGFDDETLLEIKGYSDEQLLQLTIPQLFDEIIGVDYSGDIAEKVNKAPLLTEFTDDDKMAIISFFTGLQAEDDDLFITQVNDIITKFGTFKKLLAAFTDFKSSWIIEEMPAKEFTVSGQQKNYDGYHCTVTVESIALFIGALRDAIREDEGLRKQLDQYYENLKFMLSEQDQPIETREQYYAFIDKTLAEWQSKVANFNGPDPSFTIYLDDQNRAVGTYCDYEYADLEATFKLEKRGGATLDENMTGQLKITSSEENAIITLERNGTTTNDTFDVSIALSLSISDSETDTISYEMNSDFKSNKWQVKLLSDDDVINAEVSANGSYADIEKGKGYQVNVDQFDIKFDDERLFGINGYFKVSTETDQVVKLSDDYSDALTMTEKDFKKIERQIKSNGFMMMFSLQKFLK